MSRKPSDTSYDIGILTVIPVEFAALKKAFKIDTRNRTQIEGSTFYETIIYSKLLDRPLKIVSGCIGEATQAHASIMATKMISAFNPSLMILMGIAAGMRGKLRIGDVIVPREVADLSVNVLMAGGSKVRPQIKPLSYAVKQMLPGFSFDEEVFHGACRELFGPPIIPKQEEEIVYAKHVTFKPRVLDNAVGSADNLLKTPVAFENMLGILDTIRAAEMEAGGFIKACESQVKAVDWMVVRGISDFGDELKNDDFHTLASCAASAWLKLFVEDGFYLYDSRTLSRSAPVDGPGNVSIDLETSFSNKTPHSADLVFDNVESKIESLLESANVDRLRDLEEIREKWRTGKRKSVLENVRNIKNRADWKFLSGITKGKYLRFEASLILNLYGDADAAGALAQEAQLEDPSTRIQTLKALIAYSERNHESALSIIDVPVTLEEWNLRLAILLENKRQAEVLLDSEKPPRGTAPDAESKRLIALAHLLSNDISKAQLQIAESLEMQPTWFTTRFTYATVNYFESLAPAILKSVDKSWPAPISMSYVRRDKHAVQALKSAAKVFEQLLIEAEGDVEVQKEIEGWKLACLANDTECQQTAQQYCVSLLERDPTNTTVLAWATVRGYVLDLGSSIDALLAELFPI